MPVKPIPGSHLDRIFDPSPWSNPASYEGAANDDRPDLYECLRSVAVKGGRRSPARPSHFLVSLPAKLLVAAVWIVCAAYCIAIWLKVVP